MLDQIAGGLALGGVYALIALGYTMVYGIIELINFAHGEVMMFGVFYVLAYNAPQSAEVAQALAILNTALMFAALEPRSRARWGRHAGLGVAAGVGAAWGLATHRAALAEVPATAAVPLAIVSAAVLGAALDRVAYKPLRDSPRLILLISAIGASLVLQNLAQLIFGTRRHALPLAVELSGRHVPGTEVSLTSAIIIGTALFVMAALHFFISRTKLGMAMRATAQDRTAAALMGVSVNGVITLTFVIGSSLAAIGGLLFTIHQKTLWPYMGFMAGIKAFTAAVLGGIGSIPGAMLGGFLLGIIESLGAGWIDAGYKDAIAFLVLILVLLVRPTGLLGRRTVVKV